MMKLAEAVVFLSLATSLHLGVWAASPASNGVASNGPETEAPVVLAAASPAMAAVARQWQRPPDVTAELVAQPNVSSDATMAPKIPRPADRGMTLAALPTRPKAPALAAPPVAQTEAPARVALTQTQPPPSLAAHAPDLAMPLANPHRQTVRSARPAPMPAPTSPTLPRHDAPPRADTVPPAPVATPAPTPQASPPPEPRRTEPHSNAPAQNAAKAGQERQDAPNAAQSELRNALQAKWGARIQRKVHRSMVYPRAATGSGTARVALTVDRSGRLVSLRLVRSSGVAAFDAAALEAVKRARRFAKAPQDLSKAQYSFTLSLSFRP